MLYSDPVPSCYGNKLETLIRLPGPIRTLESPEELLPENHSLNAPREVMRLVNRLMGNNEPQEDLFVQLPDEEMITVIREVCDSRSLIQYPWRPFLMSLVPRYRWRVPLAPPGSQKWCQSPACIRTCSPSTSRFLDWAYHTNQITWPLHSDDQPRRCLWGQWRHHFSSSIYQLPILSVSMIFCRPQSMWVKLLSSWFCLT